MRPINKEILRLALPSILANITVPLVGMVDIAVAGHLDPSAAALIGGISIGSLMFDMMYWNFGFLRAGTGGMTAQAFGRKDWADCSAILRRSMVTALLMAVILLAIQWPFQKLIFVFVRCSDEVKALALKYFYIRVWAAPATLCLMALRGWFIGMQDTFSSMLTDVTVNAVNILASLVLGLGIPGTTFHGIGYSGIAWGTLIAQYSGLLLAGGILIRKYRDIIGLVAKGGVAPCASRPNRVTDAKPSEVELASLPRCEGGNRKVNGRHTALPPDTPPQNTLSPITPLPIASRPELRQFFTVNRDLFIRSLCLMGVYLAFSAISARFGDTLLAMCSIMMKLMMIFSYFTDGFAFAGEALTGKHIGMGDAQGVRQAVKWTFVWSMGIGLFFIGIYAVAGIPMFRIMTSDTTVVESAREFIPWLVAIPLLGCPAFTWDGIYIGATATKQMRDSNIGCLLAFFAVWFLGIFLLHPEGAARVHLLFAAYYAHLIYRSLYQTLKYRPAILGRMVS